MIIERLGRLPGGVVSVDRAAAHCRVGGDDSYVELLEMSAAATREMEDYAGLALLTQTIRVTMECWSRASMFPLPVAPLLDPLSVSVTVDGAAFEAFAVIMGLRPALRLTSDMPSGVIVIEYEAGFGALGDDVPADLRMAILDQVAVAYDARGVTDPRQGTCLSPHMARTAARYRRVAL